MRHLLLISFICLNILDYLTAWKLIFACLSLCLIAKSVNAGIIFFFLLHLLDYSVKVIQCVLHTTVNLISWLWPLVSPLILIFLLLCLCLVVFIALTRASRWLILDLLDAEGRNEVRGIGGGFCFRIARLCLERLIQQLMFELRTGQLLA